MKLDRVDWYLIGCAAAIVCLLLWWLVGPEPAMAFPSGLPAGGAE